MIVTDLASLNCTAVILAGGAANRFGGVNKGLQRLGKFTLVEHVANAFPQTWPIVLSTHDNSEKFKHIGFECIDDKHDEYAGPMKAITDIAGSISTAYLAVSPCDTPFINQSVYQQLSDQRETAAYAVNHGREHYCCFMARVDAITTLEEEPRSMRHLLAMLDASPVNIEEPATTFTNINSQQDLLKAEQSLQQQQ